MLRQVWKTNRGSAAFQACIAHFNFISSWVGTMILSPPKVKNRAKMMEKFISIAKVMGIHVTYIKGLYVTQRPLIIFIFISSSW